MRGVNDDEVADMAALTFDHPYDVRFLEYMPIGQVTPWQWKAQYVSNDEVLGRPARPLRTDPHRDRRNQHVARVPDPRREGPGRRHQPDLAQVLRRLQPPPPDRQRRARPLPVRQLRVRPQDAPARGRVRRRTHRRTSRPPSPTSPSSPTSRAASSAAARCGSWRRSEDEAMPGEDQVIVGDFSWHSSRTPNSRCRVAIRDGQGGVPKVYIDAIHADTGHVMKVTYFRKHELPEIIAALRKPTRF